MSSSGLNGRQDAPEGPPAHAPAAGRRYVLVADANRQRAAWALDAIKDFNVGLLVARDGEEAIGILARFGPPVLLVVDLSLSRQDGFAVIDALRGGPGSGSEIIGWSASRDQQEFARQRFADRHVHVLRGSSGSALIRTAIVRAFERHARGSAAAPSPSSEVSVEEIDQRMAHLAGQARELARVPGIAVYVRAPGTTHFRASVSWTSDALMPHSAYHLPRIFDWIQESGKAIVLPDMTAQPLSGRHPATPPDEVRGLAAVPIRASGDQVVGVICVFDLRPLTLGDADLEALEALGRSVAFLQPAEAGAEPSREHGPVTDERPAASAPTAALADMSAMKAGLAGEGGAEPAAARPAVPSQAARTEWPTPLLDRTSGEFAMARELARTRREQKQLSVVLFDLSSPSREEARAAPPAPALLDRMGEILLREIRQSDLPIRWSRSELLVVLPGLGGAGAHAVAERVRAALHAGADRRVPVSGGVAELIAPETFGAVIDRAQERVRLAQQQGRNRVA
ncbi:MAG: GAF domain-containing protein [Acidobacteria bacterium]|nr:GAF domain-containing protein [Acidobacteriota bacterium]